MTDSKKPLCFSVISVVPLKAGSPLFANVFLHYVYDLWVQQGIKQKACGEMIVVRFVDDTVVGLQYESDANRFQMEIKERLLKLSQRWTHTLRLDLKHCGRRKSCRNAKTKCCIVNRLVSNSG